MSLLLNETGTLAAPLDSLPMEPTLVQPLWGNLFSDIISSRDPGFLVQARSLVERNPESAVAWIRLAQAEFSTGDPAPAAAAARRGLDFAGTDSTLILTGARILAAAGDSDAAYEALRGFTDGPACLVVAGIEASRGELETALSRIKAFSTPEAAVLRGWIFLRLQKYSDAISCFRFARRNGVASPSLLTNLGVAHAAVGAHRRAISETLEARSLAPTNRLISLNLVGYFLSMSDYNSALGEVARIRAVYPNEVRFALSEANVHLQAGDIPRALNSLRRVRTSSLWATADESERIQIETNLAFVKWQMGTDTLDEARQSILSLIDRDDFRTPEITGLLPPLFMRHDDAPIMRRVLERLSRTRPDETLERLEVQVALLEERFVDAAVLARSWAARAVFDPSAAASAVYLLVDVLGEFDEAVNLGEEALKRAPRYRPLVNNLAYALGMAGRYDRARSVLASGDSQSPQLIATAGLIDVLAGEVERGLAAYDRAREAALARGDLQLAALVALYKHLAGARAKGAQLEMAELLADETIAEAIEDPHLALVRLAAQFAPRH